MGNNSIFGDVRKQIYTKIMDGCKCIYCGSDYDSREHLPSRILLDDLTNATVIPSCKKCNNSFSNDELYFASFIELYKNKLDSNYKIRSKVKKALEKNIKQHNQIIKELKGESYIVENTFQQDRIKNIILKLSIGHLAQSLDENLIELDSENIEIDLYWNYIYNLNRKQLEYIGNPIQLDTIFEVGTIANEHIVIGNSGKVYTHWVNVNEGLYSFRYSQKDNISIEILFNRFIYSKVEFHI